MLRGWKENWRELKRSSPGSRFHDYFERSRVRRERPRWWIRALRLVAACVAICIGIVLVFIPGPAILFFMIAALLLASDSARIARALDWLELRLRIGWRWLRRKTSRRRTRAEA
jgi:hypothetical protein